MDPEKSAISNRSVIANANLIFLLSESWAEAR